MKFFVKSNIIIFILVIDLIVLLVFSSLVINENSKSNKLPAFDFSEGYNPEEYYTKKAIQIVKKDIVYSKHYETELIFMDDSERVTSYIVDSQGEIFYGQLLEKNQIIGTLDGTEVTSAMGGKVVSIMPKASEDSIKYEICVYSINNLLINVYVPQNDFYSFDFKAFENQSYLRFSSKEKISVTYKGIDYSYGIKNGNVKLLYEAKDDKVILLPGVEADLWIDYEILKSQYTIDVSDFPSISYQSTFKAYKRDGSNGSYTYKQVEVVGVKCKDSDVIIKGDGFFDGETIFVFE